MASQKLPIEKSGSFEIDILLLSSDASEAESFAKTSTFKTESKKARPNPEVSFDLEDMHMFWGVEQKRKFEAFKKRPVVPGRVVNLEQLKESHCPVSSYFRTKKLSLLLRLSGLEYYEEPLHLFYVNFRVCEESGDLETLLLGNHIIVNEFLFEEVFGSEFFW